MNLLTELPNKQTQTRIANALRRKTQTNKQTNTTNPISDRHSFFFLFQFCLMGPFFLFMLSFLFGLFVCHPHHSRHHGQRGRRDSRHQKSSQPELTHATRMCFRLTFGRLVMTKARTKKGDADDTPTSAASLVLLEAVRFCPFLLRRCLSTQMTRLICAVTNNMEHSNWLAPEETVFDDAIQYRRFAFRCRFALESLKG